MENFNLSEHLVDCEIIVNYWKEFNETTRYKQRKIAEGLTLFLYEGGQAALEFGKDGSSVFEFYYTDEVAKMFANFAYVSAFEMFDVLKRNKWIAGKVAI